MITGLEYGGNGSSAKQCGKPLETENKEKDSPLQPATQPCQLVDFNPVGPTLDF